MPVEKESVFEFQGDEVTQAEFRPECSIAYSFDVVIGNAQCVVFEPSTLSYLQLFFSVIMTNMAEFEYRHRF